MAKPKKMTEDDVDRLQNLIGERALIQYNLLRLKKDGVKLLFDDKPERSMSLYRVGYMCVVHEDGAMEADLKDFASSAMRKRLAQISDELAQAGVE